MQNIQNPFETFSDVQKRKHNQHEVGLCTFEREILRKEHGPVQEKLNLR
jgi:hypothetical protein